MKKNHENYTACKELKKFTAPKWNDKIFLLPLSKMKISSFHLGMLRICNKFRFHGFFLEFAKIKKFACLNVVLS